MESAGLVVNAQRRHARKTACNAVQCGFQTMTRAAKICHEGDFGG
jgi:hypothetical protein